MKESIAPERLRQKILMWAAIAGLFFGPRPLRFPLISAGNQPQSTPGTQRAALKPTP